MRIFSLVSGTTLRFLSLVAAILGTGTYALSLVYLAVPAPARQAVATYARCEEVDRRTAVPTGLDLDSYAAATERHSAIVNECRADFERTEAGWLLAGLALLLVIAAVLYLIAPWWTRRRHRLVPVTGTNFPQLHAALVEATAVAGLRRAPEFVLDPVARTPGGLTFGRFGRYTVRMNAGLVPLRVTDPAIFRAVVLHELAHIRNGDVDLGYATMALWRAFVAVALLPMIVVSLHPAILGHPFSWPWSVPGYGELAATNTARALLFVLVVYLCRNAVLRTRELYADARAAGFGVAGGLRRAVSAGRSLPGLRRFGVHPDPATRLRAIDDPTVVLRPGVGELFGAGLTTVIAASTISFLGALALPHTGTPAAGTVAWVIAPLAIGVLAAAAWRGEVLAALGGRRSSVLPAALGFGLGWLLGDLLALNNSVAAFGVFGGTGTSGQVGFGDGQRYGTFGIGTAVIGALLLLAGMACQSGVSAAGARGWLPTLRGPGTRWAFLATVAVGVAPFAVWYGIWSEVRGNSALIGHIYHFTVHDAAGLGVAIWPGPGFNALTTMYPPLTIFGGRALALPALALAWAYPLAARLRRPRPPVDLRYAVLAGLTGAGVFATLLIASRAAIHQFAPGRAAAVDFTPYFYYAFIAGAVMIQAVVGGLIAARGRPFGLILGQLATAVLAVGAVVAVFSAQALGSCVPLFRFRANQCGRDLFDAGYGGRLLVTIWPQGAAAALIVGSLVLAVAALAAHLPQAAGPTRRWLRPAAVAGTVLVVLVAGVAVAGTRYGNGTEVAVPLPAPISPDPASPGSTSPGSTSPPPAEPAGPGRVLTAVEAEQVARVLTAELPSYWHEQTPSTGDGNVTDPPACMPLADESYLETISGSKQASAHVSVSDGGQLASTVLSVTVASYSIPVPASVFAAAAAARDACRRFAVTTPSGFQVEFTVSAGTPPRAGEQAWRTDSALFAGGSVDIRGTQVSLMVRIRHTLIMLALTAVNLPVDEALLLAALNRVVAAVP